MQVMDKLYAKMIAELGRRNDEIRALRSDDSKRWTLAVLGIRYGLTPQRILAICKKVK